MAQQPRYGRGTDRDERWTDDFRDFRSHNHDDSSDFGQERGRFDERAADSARARRGRSSDEESYREDYSQGGEGRGSEAYRGGAQWADPSYRRGEGRSDWNERGSPGRGSSPYGSSFERNNDDTPWSERQRYGGGMSRGGGYGNEASRHIGNDAGGQGNYGTLYGGSPMGGQGGQARQQPGSYPSGMSRDDPEAWRAAANPGSRIWENDDQQGGQRYGQGQYGGQGQSQEHRGRGPKNYSRSDDRIREDVCDHLTDHGWVDATEVNVEVKNGEVTLTGTVADRKQRRHAEEAAERISGVSYVQNNLRVEDGTSHNREQDKPDSSTGVPSRRSSSSGSSSGKSSTSM